ncbi:unnamed protein product [Mytilus coruscus]|uniref:C1q domain-containing protein n=1 Tax=Mytilus coruscus TaxID=42192 RepID=A0A6J8BMR7_MYTCO|nr:unnamed protein product [Mytilus coruscus]
MSKFWVSKILAFSLFCQAGYAFLLDGSTVRPNGGSQYLTTRHYVQLMDSLYEEKQARHQLEQIVATLQTKLDAMNNYGGQQAINLTTYILPYVSRLEKQEKELKAVQTRYGNLLQTKDAEITKLSSTMTVLEQNYTSLLHDSTVTQANYKTLKLEVEGLKQIKNLDVANGLQETKNDINMLKASNQARSQDFLALYNLTISAKKDISISKKELDNIYNGSVVDTKIQDLNDKMYRLEMSHNLTSLQVNTNVKKVGFTARGGRIISGDLIEFTDIMTSYGLSMHSAYTGGIYHVTYPGYYLITINIFATKDAYFYIRKNNAEIVAAIVHYNGSENGFHMASASAFVQLSSGDTVRIKGFRVGSVDGTSSMTIVRI